MDKASSKIRNTIAASALTPNIQKYVEWMRAHKQWFQRATRSLCVYLCPYPMTHKPWWYPLILIIDTSTPNRSALTSNFSRMYGINVSRSTFRPAATSKSQTNNLGRLKEIAFPAALSRVGVIAVNRHRAYLAAYRNSRLSAVIGNWFIDCAKLLFDSQLLCGLFYSRIR